ncbi:hypothetical protein DFS33DRAFT_1336833 [Desarmillaria ectypa]|nr:hypothetical protein DFS33DRAFT_1336833 [Desarmillaria ectypa]
MCLKFIFDTYIGHSPVWYCRLIEDLGVPSDHIQCLLGPIDNPTSPGVNIIIFGSLYCINQALCPIDRASFDDKGTEILDISGREIETIFSLISLEKGHKITLILDCGHWCPRSKSVPPIGTRRTFRNLPPFLSHAMEPMLEGAHQRLAAYPQYLASCSVAAYDWQPDTSSHVVLAACRKDEFAQEEEDDEGTTHGAFIKSLVDPLRSGQLSKGSTFVDLISGLPKWPYQTPWRSQGRSNLVPRMSVERFLPFLMFPSSCIIFLR